MARNLLKVFNMANWLPFPLSESAEVLKDLSPGDAMMILHKGVWQFLVDYVATVPKPAKEKEEKEAEKVKPEVVEKAEEGKEAEEIKPEEGDSDEKDEGLKKEGINGEKEEKEKEILDLPSRLKALSRESVEPYTNVMKHVIQNNAANLADSYIRFFA
eukprot:TRINITY_DN9041_c0_g1_i1.p1 TRINITY_DN9041_c0_g1~~TRINITY_DN9041_c0_g1_i1.p1  ORF type:complete len:158 (+),score=52.87 TRINITY_DN9041_c0_g1_i1:463-936(+)